MYIKIQNLSVNILNSKYNFIFNILISFIIYLCLNGNCFLSCTDENLPLIAEPKVPITKGTILPSPLQVEVAGFLDQEGTIIKQKLTIDSLTESEQRLISQNANLDDTIQRLMQEKTALEIEKRVAEQQRQVYAEHYESLHKKHTELIEICKEVIPKAYKKGHSHGTLAVGLVALGMVSIAALANAVKRN
jgi:hypothetical protein